MCLWVSMYPSVGLLIVVRLFRNALETVSITYCYTFCLTTEFCSVTACYTVNDTGVNVHVK